MLKYTLCVISVQHPIQKWNKRTISNKKQQKEYKHKSQKVDQKQNVIVKMT